MPVSFKTLSVDVQNRLVLLARKEGAWKVSNKFAGETGMSVRGLYMALQTKLKSLNGEEPKKELTASESDFLRRLEAGEADVSEGNRIIAVSLYRRMFENPNDVRFIDYFRGELLKLKQGELEVKENWTKELLLRLFAGKLPPATCPHCGKPIGTQKVLEVHDAEFAK